MKTEGANTVSAGDYCLKFQAVLPAYLEGENHAEVTAHAAVCEYCRCLLADVENIRQAGSEPGMDEPAITVWASVRATLIEEGIIQIPDRFERARVGAGGRWFPWNVRGFLRYPAPIAAAAAVIVVCVVLFKAPGYLVHSPMQSVNTLHAAAFMQGDVAPQDIASLRQTINQLDQAYLANQASLEPSMRETYQKSLDSLNGEIQECRASMKEQPGDGLTQDYLSNAYVEKARLLQTALEYNLR
ncbi:MAG: hypothetical protein ACRD18_11825 [Terriglobia bacterium]